MGYSKAWFALTLEERKIKRKEYNDRYKTKHPERVREHDKAYKERNKEVLRVKATIHQKKKNRGNKIKAIEYKGNKCFDCGQTFSQCCYDFHHIDPTIKDNTIARIIGRDFDKIKSELDKCVLLCSNCHRIRHFNNNLYPYTQMCIIGS